MSITAVTLNADELGKTIVERIRSNALDEAQVLLEQLNEAYPHTRRQPVFPVMIAIQRGRAQDAWQLVNGLPDEEVGPLKALCLRRLGDPSWHGYAEANRDHPDPRMRSAMRSLLGCPEADDIHEIYR
jgi:type III secretion protein HrpB1